MTVHLDIMIQGLLNVHSVIILAKNALGLVVIVRFVLTGELLSQIVNVHLVFMTKEFLSVLNVIIPVKNALEIMTTVLYVYQNSYSDNYQSVIPVYVHLVPFNQQEIIPNVNVIWKKFYKKYINNL